MASKGDVADRSIAGENGTTTSSIGSDSKRARHRHSSSRRASGSPAGRTRRRLFDRSRSSSGRKPGESTHTGHCTVLPMIAVPEELTGREPERAVLVSRVKRDVAAVRAAVVFGRLVVHLGLTVVALVVRSGHRIGTGRSHSYAFRELRSRYGSVVRSRTRPRDRTGRPFADTTDRTTDRPSAP